MRVITLTLVAEEPIIVSNGPSEGMAHSSLDYIPGWMILGAMASRWVRQHPEAKPDDDGEFQQLFFSGAVSWGCALPMCDHKPCVPMPQCYMREKSMGGLPVEGQNIPPDQCAVYNVLALKDEENLAEMWRRDYRKADQPAKFKKLTDSYMQPDIMRLPPLHKTWNTRVALGQTRHALEGQLFGFSANEAGSQFQAQVYCEDEALSALRSLFKGLTTIRVGGSRTAGYGLLAVTMGEIPEESVPALQEATPKVVVFLESPYIAPQPWDDPLTSLKILLEEKFKTSLTEQAQFVTYETIQGFNVHWGWWRDSRKALAAGSVIEYASPTAIQTPARLALGADQVEGYGRILFQPKFLAKAHIEIPHWQPEQEAKASAPSPQGPVGRLLCRRASERYGRRQALLWLHEKPWGDFVKSAGELGTPTASQRANVMGMNLADFELMLTKTPGEQWKKAVCKNPFEGGRSDYLAEIMKQLLDKDAFLRRFPLNDKISDALTPLGNEGEAKQVAYEIFKRELLRSWGKTARSGQATGAKE